MAALSFTGAQPERSDSFRYAAYGRKPTVVADSIQILANDSSLTHFPITRDLGPPAVIMENMSAVRKGPPSPPRECSGPIFGELIVVGSNGSLRSPALSPKMRHNFVLRRMDKPSGIRPVLSSRDKREVTPGAYSVSVTLPKLQTHVTEFEPDPDTDLFQIGRSADSCISFVVIDTEEDKNGKEQYKPNSTVSRYACRILCERKPPYTARLYAAAFDTTKKIKISTLAPTWSSGITQESDGLTTNGVMLMHPSGYFEQGVSPGEWKEVTVMGNIRKVRVKRSAKTPGAPIPADNNILTDGCLIDLCGVTLMWRSAMGLEQTPTQKLLSDFRRDLNDGFMHCPVGLQTLYIPKGESPQLRRTASESGSTRFPWAYLRCGHVHGNHDWKADQNEDNRSRTCPICRQVGPFVRLSIGVERGYCLDTKPPTHAFVPCGHMCSESTARYWSSVSLPYILDVWGPVCPFCKDPLVPVEGENPFVKLIFS